MLVFQEEAVDVEEPYKDTLPRIQQYMLDYHIHIAVAEALVFPKALDVFVGGNLQLLIFAADRNNSVLCPEGPACEEAFARSPDGPWACPLNGFPCPPISLCPRLFPFPFVTAFVVRF